MHSGDRGVDRDDPVDLPGGVGLLLHFGEQLLPCAVRSPPVEALVDRVPLPEPRGHIAPRRARAVLPRHPLDRKTMVRPRPRATLHRRHQRLQHVPHLVRDLLSRHDSRLAHATPKPLDQHGLKTAGLLGLGQIGTAVLFAGMLLAIVMMIASGLAAALITMGAVGLLLLLTAVRDRHGQSALARTVTRIGWMNTRRKRNNIYRSGRLGRTDWGTTQLPGLAAGSRLSEWRDSYQRPFALIQHVATSDFTIVLGSDPDGSSLVDEE